MAHYIVGTVKTAAGEVPKVSTALTAKDVFGSWLARWGVNRMHYGVPPGLYCVGDANPESPVVVSANYKMSFDVLRKNLAGLAAWILVIDTRGINVWCAAGKGTFGTDEIVGRLAEVDLAKVVSHRTIIVPQLGAPGVAAHEVSKRSGFAVVYGPVRASDLPAFLAAGLQAASAMRRVNFTFRDRIVLTPIELVGVLKPAVVIGLGLVVLQALGFDVLSLAVIYPYIGAVLVGCVVAPALLPWLPGRAFSLKGWLAGAVWTVVVAAIDNLYLPELSGWRNILIYFLTVPPLAAFLTLNFTGCSTYTSFSGVKKETALSLPLLGCSFLTGVVLLLAGLPGIW